MTTKKDHIRYFGWQQKQRYQLLDSFSWWQHSEPLSIPPTQHLTRIVDCVQQICFWKANEKYIIKTGRLQNGHEIITSARRSRLLPSGRTTTKQVVCSSLLLNPSSLLYLAISSSSSFSSLPNFLSSTLQPGRRSAPLGLCSWTDPISTNGAIMKIEIQQNFLRKRCQSFLAEVSIEISYSTVGVMVQLCIYHTSSRLMEL